MGHLSDTWHRVETKMLRCPIRKTYKKGENVINIKTNGTFLWQKNLPDMKFCENLTIMRNVNYCRKTDKAAWLSRKRKKVKEFHENRKWHFPQQEIAQIFVRSGEIFRVFAKIGKAPFVLNLLFKLKTVKPRRFVQFSAKFLSLPYFLFRWYHACFLHWRL